MTHLLPHLGVVAAGTALLMTILWFVQRRIKDAGVVDVGWAFSLGAAGVYFALALDGDPLRRAVVGVLVGAWGMRLAMHLLTDRVLRGDEDGRYQELRTRWGGDFDRNIFLFFQAQMVTVVVLALPFALAASDSRDGLRATDFIAIALWLVGLVGEGVADAQLKRFKRKPGVKGQTCREGLWAYSRHPNYFFTWIVWCAFGVAALGAPWGWVGLTAPAIILFLILKVTGIPPTEKRALESRPESYRKYQLEVSAFVPWFPKREGAPA